MNGFVKRATSAACLIGAGLAGGCVHKYADVVDPCYPQRYNAVARAEVIGAFAPQVHNGHILDQTLWNYHFETGSAKLHPSGYDKLDYLMRRRPVPDSRVFLQTARDISYDAAKPDEFADARRELDAQRIMAIQAYLHAQTAGRPMGFDVVVHDPAPTGISADEAILSVRSMRAGARGGIGSGLLSAGGSAAVSGTTGAINVNTGAAGAGGAGAGGAGAAGAGSGGPAYGPPGGGDGAAPGTGSGAGPTP